MIVRHNAKRLLLSFGMLRLATTAIAQTVGPGTITVPVLANTGTGNLTIVVEVHKIR